MIIEPETIQEWIDTREKEAAEITAQFAQRKAETEQYFAEWRQYGNAAQLKLTRIEGRILELRDLLQSVQAVAPPKSDGLPT